MTLIHANERPYRVGILLIDDFALLSYASTIEPLQAANRLAERTLYDIRHLPAEGASSRSAGGATVRASAFVGEHVDFDLVLVIAGGDPTRFNSSRVFHWLRHLALRGTVLGGVSAGAVILARAGVMHDRRMTLHWEHAAALQKLMPDLVIERSLYVMDRDRYTCAGGTAPLDMMHALITRQHGATFARRISDWILHTDVRPAAGPQQMDLAERYQVRIPAILTAIEAMENHVGDPLELAQLAAIAGVGTRQLNRLFQSHLHSTTMAFYRTLRLDKARALLRESSLSISEVASVTGFANVAHFSRCFAQHFEISPSALRRDFRAS